MLKYWVALLIFASRIVIYPCVSTWLAVSHGHFSLFKQKPCASCLLVLSRSVAARCRTRPETHRSARRRATWKAFGETSHCGLFFTCESYFTCILRSGEVISALCYNPHRYLHTMSTGDRSVADAGNQVLGVTARFAATVAEPCASQLV